MYLISVIENTCGNYLKNRVICFFLIEIRENWVVVVIDI